MIYEVEPIGAEDKTRPLAKTRVAFKAEVPSCQAGTGDNVPALIARNAVPPTGVEESRRPRERRCIEPVARVPPACGPVRIGDQVRTVCAVRLRATHSRWQDR